MGKLLFTIIALAIVNIAESQTLLPEDRTAGKAEYLYRKAIEQFYINFDSSEYYFTRAMPLLQQVENREKYVECFNYLSALNYYRGNFEAAGQFVRMAEKEALRYFSTDQAVHSSVLNNKGAYYNKIGEYKRSDWYFKKAMTLAGSTDGTLPVIATLHNIGLCYERGSDYDQAISYYKQAINIARHSEILTAEGLASCYLSIGDCMNKKGDLKDALDFYKKADFALSGIYRGDYLFNQKRLIANKIAGIFLQQGETEKALRKVQDALSFPQEGKKLYLFLSYSNLGKVRQLQGYLQKAKSHFVHAITEAGLQYQKFCKHPVLAEQYYNLARFELKFGNLNSALQNYQKAINYLALDSYNQDIRYNPPSPTIIACADGIKILKGKAEALTQRFDRYKNPEDLKTALHCHQVIDELIMRTRQAILSNSSKQHLARKVHRLYEDGIHIASRLYRLTSREKYLHQAWSFAERNKATILLESLKGNLARNYSGLPANLREKERKLRTDINLFKKKISEEKQLASGGNSNHLAQWESHLLELTRQYHDFIDILEKRYPRYYQLKYDTRQASISAVRNFVLDGSSALIEYFAGEKHLFAFLITPDLLKLIEVPVIVNNDPEINSLLELLNTPDPNGTQHKNFANSSYRVFQKYLAPLLSGLPATTKRLLIIPDGALYHLPFEVLLKNYSPNSEGYDFRSFPYLINDYQFSYSYSATLLLNSLNRKSPKELAPLLAMAPSFNNHPRLSLTASNVNLQPRLFRNQKEVQMIGKLMNAPVITGQSASRQHFLDNASSARILHLATHSLVDKDNYLLSRIYFSDGHLSSYDLFNLDLKSELAVLSSCNTGSGRYVQGEGIMSLSRFFLQAGVHSTLISLWSVDDYATSEVMVLFYQYLQKGISKDQALRQAKLDFLENASKARQHPYFWAAFTQMGSFKPLEAENFKQYNRWKLLPLAFLLTAIIAIGVWRRRYWVIG